MPCKTMQGAFLVRSAAECRGARPPCPRRRAIFALAPRAALGQWRWQCLQSAISDRFGRGAVWYFGRVGVSRW
eukprot:4885962-Pyramimonas_sp.AAC.1